MSDHFDGKRFFFPGTPPAKGFVDVLKWQLTKDRKEWPQWVDVKPKTEFSAKVEEGTAHLTFVNHATVLIQTPELNILTDPIWSDRASPVSWAGPKRVHEPGVNILDLPKIHVVIISHNHFDHLDIPTLVKLKEKFNPLIILPLGHKDLFKKYDLDNFVELDWWETHVVENLEFTLTPVQHWSARGITDRYKSLWGGFVVKKKNARLFFGGDTGYNEKTFKEIQARLGSIDIGLIPIGAYEPRNFMRDQHVNPEEAVKIHLDLKAKVSMGLHFGTFQLTDEGRDEPSLHLKKELDRLNIPHEQFVSPVPGQTFVWKY